MTLDTMRSRNRYSPNSPSLQMPPIGVSVGQDSPEPSNCKTTRANAWDRSKSAWVQVHTAFADSGGNTLSTNPMAEEG